MSALAFARAADDDTSTELADIQAKLTNYLNAVALITADAHTMRNAVLVAVDPNNVPVWYGPLKTNFTNAQTHAANWLDNIMPDFTRVPQAIINYNNTFTATYVEIMGILTAIGAGDPTPKQRTDLLALFGGLTDELTTQKANIKAVQDEIKSFNVNLAADNTALTTGATNIATAIADDMRQVENLSADILRLRAEIADMNRLMTASEFGVAGFFVVSMLMMNTGPLALAVGVIGVGASVAGIITATVKIRKDQSKIDDDQAQITQEQAQIVVLKTIANTVATLVSTITNAEAQMDPVLSTWATLGEKMKAVTDKLAQASGPDFLKIMKEMVDMNASKAAWGQLADFATKMQDTPITISTDAPVPIPRAA
ncbi:MAG: HBL/NHE enterotoxin family protein [Pyrinomonadaceae bacterium]